MPFLNFLNVQKVSGFNKMSHIPIYQLMTLIKT